ncbi:membrane-bound dehydrogenase domain-containing protein [Rhodopirellula maiorica SM1]|uniref:Membrane-bound dehydrogenase domain-containing protein n=1 Tax=Rhodopirellula maiorica SM1 TaxID=1265738 RepID=M5R8L5_9BACT|nr:membrane-bound dehydrogenase domain-containing protein [Rhodopirellula maiorica SM1]
MSICARVGVTAALFSIAVGLCLQPSFAQQPRVLAAHWQLTPIASAPDLVTPTGCCFDDQGRLMVIECHTHFPPDDYEGPKTDRIYRFDDSDGDGVLDRQRLFYEGGVATMNIANLGKGWFAIATRSEIVKLRDADDDGVADQHVVLLKHETAANYPHNGLGGLTLGPDGWLYVGQGENFGEPYKLIGSDGSQQIGGGEGGNVFRCKTDGSQVERVATGFWNPFGLCFDSAHRLWAVENDPDSMPPNRLIHVVRGGDYGFQFRFGRAGIHPLQSWNGEFTGTLPMTAGTGEAACAVIQHGSHLWVTSWGDNRIERYALDPNGASWTSKSEVIVQGNEDFRPVAMAIANDGSIYLTDWVDRSYPVHGKGRLWRLSRVADAPRENGLLPEITAAENEAAKLANSPTTTLTQRIDALQSHDPFIRQAAITGLVLHDQLNALRQKTLPHVQQRVGQMLAWRWKEMCDPASVPAATRDAMIATGLDDVSDAVVMTALRWAAERMCKEQLPTITERLQQDRLSPPVFSATMATIAFLETGSASGKSRDPAIEKRLIEFAGDTTRSDRLRGFALQRLPSEASSPSDLELGGYIHRQTGRELSIEVVRLLAARGTDSSFDELAKLAANETVDEQTRADAIAGLSSQAANYAAMINRSSLPKQPAAVRAEAKRVRNTNIRRDNAARPSRENIEGWMQLVGHSDDVDAGRRVFFRRGCSNCHMHSGRGTNTGPDLTRLSGQMTRPRILQSILNPSKEVGPLYVPWTVLTSDGHVLTGLKMDRPGPENRLRLLGADGNIFEVPREEIEQLQPSEKSIMPVGLEDSMTLDELADLVAFLSESRS